MADRGLINRITDFLQRLTGQAPAPASPTTPATPNAPPDEAGETTTTGTMVVSMINAWTKSIFELSSKRNDVYDTAEEMDDTVEEVNVGLDILASTAMAGHEGSQESFEIQFDQGTDERAAAVITGTVQRASLRDKSAGIIREALLHGDKFLQPVVDRSLDIVRVMQMPVRSMHRNEDDTGRLREGEAPGEWAFEQRYEKTNQFIAGFYHWQIIHLRWGRCGEDKYGRSLLYPARSSFKKLRAMEEALTINWLTRAFARLVFLLDHTGLDETTRRKKIKAFQDGLLTTRMPDGSTGKDPLTVVKDVYLSVGYHTDISDDGKPVPEMTDVKAVDTSSAGYRDLAPIKYYLRKVIRVLRVPPAFLGIEDEVNAKATLDDEKQQFAAFVRWIQSWYSLYLVELFDLALTLKGFDLLDVGYKIVWPPPFKDDERLAAQVDLLRAQADKLRKEQGVVDGEWIATRRLGMTSEKWKEMQTRLAGQATASAGGTEESDGESLLEQGGGKKDKPPASYTKADEAYRQGLQAIYDKWSAETAEALADMDPDDAEAMERKLEDALAVLMLLLHQHGESNLPLGFYLGYGGREVGSDGLRQIQGEIENNYHYLETSLSGDIRQRVAKDLKDVQDELRADRRKEAVALLIALLATRKAHVDLYAGQYWHSLWTGWARREKERTVKAGISWRLDPMAQHCRDCPGYAGDYASIDDLLAATGGCLPGQGTECDGKCRCWLERA